MALGAGALPILKSFGMKGVAQDRELNRGLYPDDVSGKPQLSISRLAVPLNLIGFHFSGYRVNQALATIVSPNHHWNYRCSVPSTFHAG
jgi:hypothetical protein